MVYNADGNCMAEVNGTVEFRYCGESGYLWVMSGHELINVAYSDANGNPQVLTAP